VPGGRLAWGVLTAVSLLVAALAASASPGPARPGALVERVACLSDPTQTYALYVPSSYSSARRWPVLLVFDPRGRGALAARLFEQAAERYGWLVLSSNDTRSDGPWEPNVKAVAAMMPDLQRYAVDGRRVYAAGFSGGAMVAWLLAHNAALAGVIASGGPLNPGVGRDTFSFPQFGAAGDTDFNYAPMKKADSILAQKGLPHRLEIFEGRHQWMPAALASEAVSWLELQAMKSGLRAVDPALVQELFAADLATAEALERAGRALAAQRRYEAIARSFDGLLDVGGPRRRAAALAPRAAREEQAERSADEWEERYQRDVLPRGLAALKDETRLEPLAALVSDLEISRLQKRGAEPSVMGVASRRALENVFTLTSFYAPRDLMGARRYARALLSLDLAAEIKPRAAFVQYDRACALARLGRKPAALAALERAVELGFSDLGLMQGDADLESLRGEPRLVALEERLAGAAQP
jgi:dienelactone hydrolase